MHKLVLLRHGQSTWNKENKFTGWVDVELSDQGREEAKRAGELLKAEGFEFDIAFSSVLRRAIETLWSALSVSDQTWVPIEKSWRLNERHYGNLQGMNKAEMTEKFGEEQVFEWRRSYATPPPAMEKENPLHPSHDRRYKNVDGPLPDSEALLQTKERVMPYWQERILPEILSGKNVVIAAHGNSLRALVKHLDNVSDEEISKLNIPTGIPLVYELDEKGQALKSYYLGDQEAAKAAADAVANQAKH